MSIQIITTETDFMNGCYNKVLTKDLKEGLKEHFNIDLDGEILENNKELEAKILWVVNNIFWGNGNILIQIGNEETRASV